MINVESEAKRTVRETLPSSGGGGLVELFRCVIEISALSTVDGRIEAYDGFDG